MPSFEKGCLVLYRPTKSLFEVVRWDREAAALLLSPAECRLIGGSRSGEEGVRTRWAFECMVDVVEKSTAKPPPEVRADGGGANNAAVAATAAAPPPGHGLAAPKLDPTSHARHTAKLNSRVEIRRHPKRGRGLFAVRKVPAGTEVMRVPAAAAVLLCSGDRTKGSCGGCLLPANEVGRLEACHGCPLSFCATCKKNGAVGGARGGSCDGDVGHTSSTCELTKAFVSICATKPAGGPPDEGCLRLLADIFARRAAGVIQAEEWDLIMSLESQDNAARTMSLGDRELRECARLLKDVMGIDVSHDEFQAMYRSVTRNAHSVSPNTTDARASGLVQGLFPCGALVNHSCLPNAAFHCLADSSSVDGRPAITQVLRTIRDVHAGDELCYSYLSASTTMSPVSERRDFLKGWDFLCVCERCQREAEEFARLETCPTPINKEALRVLRRLHQMMQLAWRDNPGSPRQQALKEELERIVEVLTFAKQRKLSPLLAGRLAIGLQEAAAVVRDPNPLVHFGVCGFAADELSSVGSSMEIASRQQQYVFSTKVGNCLELSADQSRKLEFVRRAGICALQRAAELCTLFYGAEHKASIGARELAREALARR